MRAMMGAALAAAMVTAGTGAWAQMFPRDQIRTQCSTEWRDDITLRANCIARQEFAFDVLAEMQAALTGNDLTALEFCENLHPGDFAAQLTCLDVARTPEKEDVSVGDEIPRSVRARIRGRCEGEWPSNYTAQVDCIEERAADWLEKNRERQAPVANADAALNPDTPPDDPTD